MRKFNTKLINIILIVITSSIASALTVGIIVFNRYTTNDGKSYYSLLKDENIQEFVDIYSEISSNYYEEIDKEELIKNAISGMTDYLDDIYTTSLSDEESISLINKLNGSYNGIGITISGKTIINIVPDSPAYKKGVIEGDEIISINDIEINDSNQDEISSIIQNSKKDIKMVIKRNEEEITYNVETKKISKPCVFYEVKDEIGYMKIDVFSTTASDEVEHALQYIEKSNIKGLIIDLRGNTGGYLEETNKIIKKFLKNGETIYILKDKKNIEAYYDTTDEARKYPITVLINGGTASAAEILATALKDSYGAILIGSKSFGKGKVQHTHTLKNGNIVKYTSYEWLRKNETSIDKIGIEPDYTVDNEFVYSEENPEEVIGYNDNQLGKAYELIKEMGN